MRLVFLFALCILALSCDTGQYDNGGGCTDCSTSCAADHYISAACTTTSDIVCVACTESTVSCEAGQFWNHTLCGPGEDNGCRDCYAPCDNGTYYDELQCGTAYHKQDNGCKPCQDCITSDGPRYHSWGVCGGPSPYSHHPEILCLTPGVALCEVCADYILEWKFTQSSNPDLNFSYCDNTLNDTWLFLSGKSEGDLATCCESAKAIEDYDVEHNTHVCDWSGELEELVNHHPGAAHKNCLYNFVMDCLGIFSFWPNPSPSPPEPINL
jgi:hypothetical protein